jgi:hypothetical protein
MNQAGVYASFCKKMLFQQLEIKNGNFMIFSGKVFNNL